MVLREEKKRNNYSYLSVEFNNQGDLIFEGHDLGDNVKRHFDCAEYEWTWKIKADDVPILEKALEIKDDLLEILKERFGGNKSTQIFDFLESNNIPFETWSRVGD